MFVSRFFVSLLAFAAIGVSASPTAAESVEKRSAQVTDVLAVVNTLKTKTDLILPEINALVAEGFANQATLTPLVSNLVTSLNNAHSSLSVINAIDTGSGGSPADVANAIAPIVSEITNTLNNAQAAFPGLTGILAGLGLDIALNQVLVAVELLLAGVLNLVAVLLVDIAKILSGLALGLVLGTLGL